MCTGKSVTAPKLQTLESLPTEDSDNLGLFLRKSPLCCRTRMGKQQLPGRVTEFICLPYKTEKPSPLGVGLGEISTGALLEQW